MPDLYVDIDGLRALSGRLSNIVSLLSAASDPLDGVDDALGDARVLGSVEGFRSHWRDGRQAVHDDCSTLQKMLDQSTGKYIDTDTELATQINASSGNTG